MTDAPTAAAPALTGGALSWREQLKAKRRRRVVHRLQVSEDAGDVAARADKARRTYDLVSVLPTATDELRAQAAADLQAAEAELAEHVVEIAFQSLPVDEFDALAALHPSTDPGEDGGINWRTALPVMAAACCLEEGGDDVAWWTATLSQDCWTPADLLELWGTLLRLHTRTPSARLPFA